MVHFGEDYVALRSFVEILFFEFFVGILHAAQISFFTLTSQNETPMSSKDIDQNIPSPLQEVRPFWAKGEGASLWIKRDDLIDPYISGNKWRKLKGWIDNNSDRTKVWASVGGGYSNHLLALAYWGHLNSVRTRGYLTLNPEERTTYTTWMCHQWGMELVPVGRQNAPKVASEDEILIPMGGEGESGLLGTSEMVSELPFAPDYLMTSIGTATTLTGMAIGVANLGWSSTRILGVSALKGASYLKPTVENFLNSQLSSELAKSTFEQIDWWNDDHLGGFGKITPELIRFINQFYTETGIPLDPIYTGKSMWALSKKWKEIPREATLVFWHTGGLFGGMGVQKALKSQSLDYLKKLFSHSFPDTFPEYQHLGESPER